MGAGGRESLWVRVIPGSRRPGIDGLRDGELLIRVHARPQAGQANRELLQLLAGELGVPATALQLRSGANSRRKHLMLPAKARPAVQALLAVAAVR